MGKPVAMAWTLALGLSIACTPDSKKAGETVADSTEGQTGSGEDTATSGGPGTSTTGQDPDTGSSTGSMLDTGDVPMHCSDFFDQASCESETLVDDECGWFSVSTWALDGEGACGEVDNPDGVCLLVGANDGCGLPSQAPSCPDGESTLYYREVGLEIGAVELFLLPTAGEVCSTPDDFSVCSFDGVDYDPPECECGCPGV